MKMGCDCRKGRMGQAGADGSFNPLWFLLGGVAGIGIWQLIKGAVTGAPGGPGVTEAAPLPPVASPSRYANLDSVALRLDQVKTLYRSGQMSPEQALAETEALTSAAYNFSVQEGERVNEVVAPIMAFQDQVREYVRTKPIGSRILPVGAPIIYR